MGDIISLDVNRIDGVFILRLFISVINRVDEAIFILLLMKYHRSHVREGSFASVSCPMTRPCYRLSVKLSRQRLRDEIM